MDDAVDVAGRLDTVGWGIFYTPPPNARLLALESAAMAMAEQGRAADAHRLADRAVKLAAEFREVESNFFDQMQLAAMLSHVGREEAARPFARRALVLAGDFPDPQGRAFALATIARVLARAGLAREAGAAIREARASLPESAPPAGHAELDGLVSQALARLGAVDEALALAYRRSGWPVSVPLLQVLLDGGHLDAARELAGRTDDPLAAAMVASALVSAGRGDEARALVRSALTLVEKGPGGARTRDEQRTLIHERLLLDVMPVAEAAAAIRQGGDALGQATFAVALARSGRGELARETALEAERRAEAADSSAVRGRVLVKVAEALAWSGDAERSLSAARAVVERELQASALAHAANGFAGRGDDDRAQSLIREVRQALPSIRDRDQQSLVWAQLARASIRLGRYAQALDDDGLHLDPTDRVLICAAIVRDDAVRRHPERREAFDRGPAKRLGRFGLHWP